MLLNTYKPCTTTSMSGNSKHSRSEDMTSFFISIRKCVPVPFLYFASLGNTINPIRKGIPAVKKDDTLTAGSWNDKKNDSFRFPQGLVTGMSNLFPLSWMYPPSSKIGETPCFHRNGVPRITSYLSILIILRYVFAFRIGPRFTSAQVP
jgi:hypothetical protein